MHSGQQWAFLNILCQGTTFSSLRSVAPDTPQSNGQGGVGGSTLSLAWLGWIPGTRGYHRPRPATFWQRLLRTLMPMDACLKLRLGLSMANWPS